MSDEASRFLALFWCNFLIHHNYAWFTKGLLFKIDLLDQNLLTLYLGPYLPQFCLVLAKSDVFLDSRVCGNPHGIIRKYGLMCCRQCFRSNAKEIGFIKYRWTVDATALFRLCKWIFWFSSSWNNNLEQDDTSPFDLFSVVAVSQIGWSFLHSTH